ncbi:MAG: DUF4236 domain-containing protein, partial [Balneolales bacterium]|nr:DUF4236 domain-containing protein [Balneolales bacterium]
MAFYLRKAFKTGPIRFNLSKGGVGLSAGITGARIGLNRRGAYVHGGRHGMYYRKHLKVAGGSSAVRHDGNAAEGSVRTRDEMPGVATPDSFNGSAQDIFIDTGVTYPSAISDLPDRPLPSSPKPGTYRSRRMLILSFLFIAFSIIYMPNALFVGVFLPFAVLLYDRRQHQKHQNTALRFMSFFRDWIEREAEMPESVDTETLKRELQKFKSEVPENYHPQYLQRWYIMLLEGVIEMAWHEIDWREVISELESEFELSADVLREIKISLFRTELETALEDHLLSEEEEALLVRIAGIFGLVEGDLRSDSGVRSGTMVESKPVGGDIDLDSDGGIGSGDVNESVGSVDDLIGEGGAGVIGGAIEKNPELFAGIRPADDLAADWELIRMASVVRRGIEKPLEEIESPIPLVRGEVAYGLFQPVRLLNERVLNRFQRDGVTYRELGYQSEIDAARLILT